jgi:cysteine desulfurase
MYWDYNAGAPMLPAVAEHLRNVLSRDFGNPSSVHRAGRELRRRLEDARFRVARRLGASAKEIIFTASGSEAAALAICGTYRGRKDSRRTRIVSSAIEHPSVLGALRLLRSEGAEVILVPPDSNGRIDPHATMGQLTPATALCSLQWVNNETGVIQPVDEVSRRCLELEIPFHCDAVQAFGRMPASLRETPASLMSASAHKLGGPAGVGVLFASRTVPIQPLVPGHQENGRRGGTPNVALCEALALALESAATEQLTDLPRIEALRRRFENCLRERVPSVQINGEGAPRVANTTNARFDIADGEALLIALDLKGICVSSGAACSSGTSSPSHVLLAMGLSARDIQGSIRFSMGGQTTETEVDVVLSVIEEHLARQPSDARGPSSG